jgi:hypothetical protein
MSLQGSVETIRLSELLTLLACNGKTGSLRVQTSQVDARLWLNDGQLVGTQVGSTRTFTDALFQLLRLPDARFVFEPGDQPERPSTPADVKPLLAEAQRWVAEWGEIQAVVPSLGVVVRLSTEIGKPEVMVRADQWRLLVAAAGRQVGDALDELDVGEFEGCRAVKDLVDAGLIFLQVGNETVMTAAPASRAQSEPSERLRRGTRSRRRNRRAVKEQLHGAEGIVAFASESPAAGPNATHDADEDSIDRSVLMQLLRSVTSPADAPTPS